MSLAKAKPGGFRGLGSKMRATIAETGEVTFRGIAGTYEIDRLGRVIFYPSKEGKKSAAYRKTVADFGGHWDDWVFEVDIVLVTREGRKFIEFTD